MRINVAIGILFAFVAAGCQQMTGAFTRDDYLKPEPLFVYNFADHADPQKAPNPHLASVSNTGEVPIINTSVLELVRSDSTGHTRDFIQDILIKRSDDLCNAFVDDLYVRVTSRKFTLKNLAGAASAVGTFASAVSSEMNLVSTLALGLNNSYNEDIMRGQLSTLLANQIQTDRENELKTILKKRSKKYSFSQSLLDANKYHEKCSVLSSLRSITKSTATQ
ncbi:hypothetical protein [Roseibium litorale]|uniref:Lipoprotein n=1 Tax=Roseibium litorale TaxID=2803841 RepID=A0ABR9CSW8_9HYPH|nr:hypothetical protein [Roseibium litorale]MBD8893955.1 hypothetical protein [Roseibium litorale]